MRLKNVLFTAFLIQATITIAQTRSTKETKVTVIMNAENTKILGLELFDDKDYDGLLKRHPHSKFYIGLLKGEYELETKEVVLRAKAVIAIFTERQLFPEEELFENEGFKVGDRLKLGKTVTKIVSKNKGELVLEAQ